MKSKEFLSNLSNLLIEVDRTSVMNGFKLYLTYVPTYILYPSDATMLFFKHKLFQFY